MKLNQSPKAHTPGMDRHGPSRKHIVTGKGKTAANPKAGLKSKVGYLKGPKAV